MPKRTNPFQQLIYLIQSQFANEAIITESAFLKDMETGDDVEVDILITSKVAGTVINLGIECVDRRRPATREWVLEMVKKHEALLIDKTVLVSKSGFSKSAIAKARASKAEALTLLEAQDKDWKEYVEKYLQNLFISAFRFNPKAYEIDVASESPLDTTFESLLVTVNADGTTDDISIGAFISNTLNHPVVARRLMEEWVKADWTKLGDEFEYYVAGQLPNNMRLRDGDGKLYRVGNIRVVALAHFRYAHLKLHASKFNGIELAHDTVDNIFAFGSSNGEAVNVIVTGTKDSLEEIAFTVPSSPTKTQVYRHRL